MNNGSRNKISGLRAREILDSRGIPTVSVELETGLGKFSASVPSGTSKGKYEAVEIRDGGERYQGMGVQEAVKNVNGIIAPELRGRDVLKQEEIDRFLIELDGRENKSNLGVNAILPVSMAVLRAGAAVKNQPLWKRISELSDLKPFLPVPCILYLEGGLHGKGSLDTQEIMVLLEANSFKERLRISTEIYHNLGKLIEKKYGKISAAVGLEGAFTPQITETEDAIEIIQKAISESGFKGEVKMILDMAAGCFYQQGQYFFEGDVLQTEELKQYYLDLCKKYPIIGIEDPFSEEDESGFEDLMEALGNDIYVIGDDLLASSLKRVERATKENLCNALILKPNQVGTVTESIQSAKEALLAGWKVFVKHRSGETKDDFIADLACGLGTGFLMAGAPTRGERVAKYNRLLRIEEEMENDG